MLRFQQVTVPTVLIILVNHILTFQAGLAVTVVQFKNVAPGDDDVEPLRMEHFILPIGIWGVGVVVSLLCLLAEIIIKYFENQQ